MLWLALAAGLAAGAARIDAAGRELVQPTKPAQEEFVPIDQLPPEEQLPAAPLLVTAYAFVWVALLVYLWSLWRRLARVQAELTSVARRLEERDRSG